MSPPPTPDRHAAARFWNEFAAASAHRIADLLDHLERSDDPTNVTSELEAAIRHLADAASDVTDGLSVVVSNHPPAGYDYQLIITAEGHRKLVPAARLLAAAAPPIPRWHIRALRPADPPEQARHAQLHISRPDGTTTHLAAADIHADVRPAAHQTVSLHLYIPGFVPSHNPQHPDNLPLIEATFLLLDHTLGEDTLTTRVGPITWHPPTPRPVGAVPLHQALERIDQLTPPG